MTEPETIPKAGRDPLTSMTAFFLYLFWFVGGPVLLGASVLLLIRKSAWTLSWVDAFYWGIVVAAHVARTVQAPPSNDAANAPMPVGAWRVRFTAAAAALWCLGQSLQVLA